MWKSKAIRWMMVGLAASLLAGACLGGVWFLLPPAGPYVAGQQLVYRVKLITAGHADFSRVLDGETSTAGPRRLHSSIQGELVIDVLASGKQGAELLVRVRRPEVRFASDGSMNLDLARSIESDLKKPFLVETGPDGRIKSLRLPARLSSTSAAFVRSLAAAVQFAWPQGAATTWEVEQDDPAGAMQVRYERSGAEVRRTRLSCRPPAEEDDSDEMHLTPTIGLEGTLTATVDLRKRQLLALEGRETTILSLNGQVVSRSESVVELSLVGVEKADEAERIRLMREQRVLAVAGASESLVNPSPGEEALHRTQLGDDTVEQLLAELARVDAKSETALYLKFRALIWLQPGQSKRLADVLLHAKAGAPGMRILTQALALSGQPEAQAALAGVARARKSEWGVMAEVLPALGMARRPTEEVDRVLALIAREGLDWNTRSTAQLALGTLARTLARSAPERTAAIVRWASEELAAAPTAQEKRQLLLVLGNTASARALPAVRRLLQDADPDVRGAALLALRWHTDEDVEDILCRALLADANEGVRQEAASAFEVRPATPRGIEAHIKALGGDRSPSVRLAVLARLAGWSKKAPQAAKAIRQAAEKDPTPAVREAAAAVGGKE